jgi:predicted amidohydrolase YtcJ
MQKLPFAGLFTGLVLLLSSCIQTQEADLVVHNATIYTVDEDFSTYSAMAIRDGKIIELGAEREILNRYKAKETVDAKKMSVYPGFIDAHSHFIGYARNQGELALWGVASEDEMIQMVADFAKKSDRHWVVGRGWDQNLWTEKLWPNKAQLDSLFPDRPVYLTRVDGHAALVNAEAMRLAGIDAGTKIPGGSLLLDDSDGPTGILIDRVKDRVKDIIPPIGGSLFFNLVREAEANCFAAGLTGVTDAGITVQEAMLIDSLQKAGAMHLKVNAFLKPDSVSLKFMQNGPYTTDQLTVRSVKLYGDGALGSRGALLKQPYTDDPSNTGLALMTDSSLAFWATACLEYGYQLCTHAIGDSANAWILNRYAGFLKEMNDHRWRIEHAQVISPEDRYYFRNFGIIPSVQPVHGTSDGAWAEERLGPERITHAYAYESLRNTLGILPLGTDFPVEAISPIDNFYAAVFRKKISDPDGSRFLPDEALSRENALRGMTIWAALAAFEEAQKGSLEPGKAADFVILDRDLIKAPETEVAKVKVVATYVSGAQMTD